MLAGRWLVGGKGCVIVTRSNKYSIFWPVASFPPLAPHTLENTPDSRETAQTPSQDSLLTISDLCSCRLAFLGSRQCHGYSHPAAAVTPPDPHKYELPRAILATSCGQSQSRGHWRYGWGEWRGGCCHRLRSQAQSTSVACANRRAKESQRERLSRANKWCRRSGGGRTARYTHRRRLSVRSLGRCQERPKNGA